MKPAGRQNKNTFSSFGFSTILIVFVMICIITFSALSFLTASSDYRLSKKVADHTSAYYTAEEQAYVKLSEIDSLLAGVYTHSMEQNTYLLRAYEALVEYARKNASITVENKDQPVVSYQIPVNEQQQLLVSLKVCYPPDKDGVCYELSQWQTITELTE